MKYQQKGLLCLDTDIYYVLKFTADNITDRRHNGFMFTLFLPLYNRMPSMFHADIVKWLKDKKTMVKFIKKVINVARETPSSSSVNSSNPKKAQDQVLPADEDDDPDNIGKLIDVLRRFSMPSTPLETSGATLPGNGTVFFPIFSLFRHSCICNSKFFVYPDNNLAIQAQRPISAGEEITVSRVQTLEPTWKRRAKLYRY